MNKAGTIYIVGTPIGNLSDLSPRALDTLRQVDFIAAEDTRMTLRLLNHFEIKKPLLSYYEHNKRQRGGEIIERLLSGESCALVSDAGMPCISDPGEDLIARCHESGVSVAVIPGPSAVISALAVSGMPSGRFAFEGFLSVTKKSRFEHLEMVKNDPRTLIFYEAPHKLRATLRDMLTVFGDRKIAIVRELTKIYEEVIKTTLEKVNSAAEVVYKGEIVLIVEGAQASPVENSATLPDAVLLAKELLNSGYSTSYAAKAASEKTGISKNDIYRAIINSD